MKNFKMGILKSTAFSNVKILKPLTIDDLNKLSYFIKSFGKTIKSIYIHPKDYKTLGKQIISLKEYTITFPKGEGIYLFGMKILKDETQEKSYMTINYFKEKNK